MRIAAVQHDIVWNDRDANFARLAPMVAAAAAGGAGLVLLTETFSTGFAVDDARPRRARGRPVGAVPAGASRRSTACGCAAAAPRSCGDDRRPTAVQQLRARRPRRHRAPLPQDPPVQLRRRGQALPRRRSADDRSRSTASASARSCATTCASPTSSGGWRHQTDVYLVPANWPEPRRDHWMSLLQARAIENLAYVVGLQPRRRGRRPDVRRATAASSTRSANCWPPVHRRDHPVRRHRARPRRRHPRALRLPPRPPLTDSSSRGDWSPGWRAGTSRSAACEARERYCFVEHLEALAEREAHEVPAFVACWRRTPRSGSPRRRSGAAARGRTPCRRRRRAAGGCRR